MSNARKRLSMNANELAAITGKDCHTTGMFCQTVPELGARKIGRTWYIPIERVAEFFGLEADAIRDAIG